MSINDEPYTACCFLLVVSHFPFPICRFPFTVSHFPFPILGFRPLFSGNSFKLEQRAARAITKQRRATMMMATRIAADGNLRQIWEAAFGCRLTQARKVLHVYLSANMISMQKWACTGLCEKNRRRLGISGMKSSRHPCLEEVQHRRSEKESPK